MEFGDLTIVVDAKYKRHWEELQDRGWARAEEELREQHRNDLLQVLAYGNLSSSSRIVTCLIYPCSVETWDFLRERDRLLHTAEVTVGSRSVWLWLTAIPMSADVQAAAKPLIERLRMLIDETSI